MLNKIVVSGLCLMLLAGCDDTDVKSIAVVDEQQAHQESGGTAIYLPGGAGIDFGRQPVSDEEVVFNNGSLRKVVYEFSENYEVIDEAMFSILKAEQYSRHVSVSGDAGVAFAASYQKADNKAVFVRYFVQAKDGMDKNTTLILTWPI